MVKRFEASEAITLNFESSDGAIKRLTIEPGDIVSISSKVDYKKAKKAAQRKEALSTIRRKRSESSKKPVVKLQEIN